MDDIRLGSIFRPPHSPARRFWQPGSIFAHHADSHIDTIAKWADSGAPAGDPKDAPKPIEWPSDGWQIKPDVITAGPKLDVPANGLVEWSWVVIPSPFKEDTWVTSVEVHPSHAPISHHICLAFEPHKEGVEYNRPIWQDEPRDANGAEIDQRKGVGGLSIGGRLSPKQWVAHWR